MLTLCHMNELVCVYFCSRGVVPELTFQTSTSAPENIGTAWHADGLCDACLSFLSHRSANVIMVTRITKY